MTVDQSGQVSLQAHIELLRFFLAHRREIVERIQGVLNAQRQPARYLQDRLLLSRHLDDCFFDVRSITRDQIRLKRELEEAHWASGLRPSQVAGLHNDLIDPTEMMIRGFFCWQQTRWPGRNARLRYANTLFDLYLLRRLVLSSMRIWDDGTEDAGDWLARIQLVLDELRSSAPIDLPAFVRDARWLIPVALSPTTEELAAYFEVSRHVAESFTDEDRLEVQKAAVVTLGGHLRSQIRHYCLKDELSIDDASVVRRTRTSNALDFALLIQGLVPLLDAYEQARQSGDDSRRLELAGAICQGISPDPEVFLNRVDLLGPYSMIEHLFIATDRDGQAVYTPLGRRHVALLCEFEAKIARAATVLHEDCRHFRPVDGTYSPYGAIYGTPTNLIEDMALKTLQTDTEVRFSLEDVFAETDADADADAEKLAWVSGWRKLPHVAPDVQALYAYPQAFAAEMFERIERELGRGAAQDGEKAEGKRTGSLFVLTGDAAEAGSAAASVPDLPPGFLRTSDSGIAAATAAEACDESRLLRDRREGHFVLSYQTSGGWIALSKDLLTDVLGAGRDAKIMGLPRDAAGVLRLMCFDLIAAHSAPG